jgi:hypothetical protein
MLAGRCSSQLSGHQNDERNQKSQPPSVPGFPDPLLSPTTTDVVLSLIEAATLDRKSGEAEGSAVLFTSNQS